MDEEDVEFMVMELTPTGTKTSNTQVAIAPDEPEVAPGTWELEVSDEPLSLEIPAFADATLNGTQNYGASQYLVASPSGFVVSFSPGVDPDQIQEAFLSLNFLGKSTSDAPYEEGKELDGNITITVTALAIGTTFTEGDDDEDSPTSSNSEGCDATCATSPCTNCTSCRWPAMISDNITTTQGDISPYESVVIDVTPLLVQGYTTFNVTILSPALLFASRNNEEQDPPTLYITADDVVPVCRPEGAVCPGGLQGSPRDTLEVVDLDELPPPAETRGRVAYVQMPTTVDKSIQEKRYMTYAYHPQLWTYGSSENSNVDDQVRRFNEMVLYAKVIRNDTDYLNVDIILVKEPKGTGCYSWNYEIQGSEAQTKSFPSFPEQGARWRNLIALNEPWCFTQGNTIQHEFVHALGFGHVHTRSDREQFVQLTQKTINDDQWKLDLQTPVLGPYEFASVQHYGTNEEDGAIQVACPPSVTVATGQVDYFSQEVLDANSPSSKATVVKGCVTGESVGLTLNDRVIIERAFGAPGCGADEECAGTGMKCELSPLGAPFWKEAKPFGYCRPAKPEMMCTRRKDGNAQGTCKAGFECNCEGPFGMCFGLCVQVGPTSRRHRGEFFIAAAKPSSCPALSAIPANLNTSTLCAGLLPGTSCTTIRCNAGYALKGSLTCSFGGTNYSSIPSCVQQSCTAIPSGTVMKPNLVYDMVKSCLPLPEGTFCAADPELLCGAGTIARGQVACIQGNLVYPNCVPRSICRVPLVIAGANQASFFKCGGTRPGSSCKVSCLPGYQLQGELRCRRGSNWTYPTCVQLTTPNCTTFSGNSSLYVTKSLNSCFPLRPGTSCNKVNCIAGYSAKGVLRCSEQGTTITAFPQCEAIKFCQRPASPPWANDTCTWPLPAGKLCQPDCGANKTRLQPVKCSQSGTLEVPTNLCVDSSIAKQYCTNIPPELQFNPAFNRSSWSCFPLAPNQSCGTLSCGPGFTSLSGSVTCSNRSIAKPYPTCVPRTCPSITVANSATGSVSSCFANGTMNALSRCRFRCRLGYVPTGDISCPEAGGAVVAGTCKPAPNCTGVPRVIPAGILLEDLKSCLPMFGGTRCTRFRCPAGQTLSGVLSCSLNGTYTEIPSCNNLTRPPRRTAYAESGCPARAEPCTSASDSVGRVVCYPCDEEAAAGTRGRSVAPLAVAASGYGVIATCNCDATLQQSQVQTCCVSCYNAISAGTGVFANIPPSSRSLVLQNFQCVTSKLFAFLNIPSLASTTNSSTNNGGNTNTNSSTNTTGGGTNNNSTTGGNNNTTNSTGGNNNNNNNTTNNTNTGGNTGGVDNVPLNITNLGSGEDYRIISFSITGPQLTTDQKKSIATNIKQRASTASQVSVTFEEQVLSRARAAIAHRVVAHELAANYTTTVKTTIIGSVITVDFISAAVVVYIAVGLRGDASLSDAYTISSPTVTSADGTGSNKGLFALLVLLVLLVVLVVVIIVVVVVVKKKRKNKDVAPKPMDV